MRSPALFEFPRFLHPHCEDIFFLLFLHLLLVHVSIVVPCDRYAACLVIAACTLSYAEVQKLLLHLYFDYLLYFLDHSAVCYNIFTWANGHNDLLQGVSVEFQFNFCLKIILLKYLFENVFKNSIYPPNYLFLI